MLVISDTSSLILLDKIKEIDLLSRCFDRVLTTPVVVREYGFPLPDWITVQAPTDLLKQEQINALMDAGEASVLTLAAELGNGYVLIDDNRARRYAEAVGQKYLGTFGLILRAKRSGVIHSVRPLLEKVRETDFRASEDLYQLVINEAGE
ncbi:hypothetical protein GCM10023187_16590 [Nibrella viscosa]|uniref:DUF3368 domain-containing protein n=1 Tax=Nibrella viscosa TaxID=1084524 RepID=A0ABP8K7J2_9BACT